MLELENVPKSLLTPIADVLKALRKASPDLRPDDVLILGAWSRDIIHRSLGHEFLTARTSDIDLALALDNWDAFAKIATTFPRTGSNDIRFQVGKYPVDIVAFGGVEDPPGRAHPPTRKDDLSVWALSEVRAAAVRLPLGGGVDARLPDIAGFTASKLAAWMDRSVFGEDKDAPDLALAMYWYANSDVVAERLYRSPQGQRCLEDSEADVPRAAVQLLAIDVATLLGPDRMGELLERWPVQPERLQRELKVHEQEWPNEKARTALLDALARGLRGDDQLG